MTPDPGIYSDLDYNDKKLWKIRMECKPKWRDLKVKPNIQLL